MNITNPHRLEDFIIVALLAGEQVTTKLLVQIRLRKKNVTKQGFYAALRKLKAEEVILIYKGIASLNTVWLKKMRETFDRTSKTYTTDQRSFDVLDLEDKESISYSFATIKNLDIFWGHAQNILLHNTPSHEPIYAYDPHYWFYLARPETEKELLKEITEHQRQFLMSVGGKAKLDKSISKDFNNKLLQYNLKKLFEQDNYYITVIGDYITEVFLDESISKKIHSLYESADSINNPGVIDKLKSFLDAKARSKIKISRNKVRADKLKKKMGKDFYLIPYK